MAINKGFIKDWQGNTILPITRAELVLDVDGKLALHSEKFLASFDDDGNDIPGLITAAERAKLNGTGGENISDLYNKVKHINEGLYVKTTGVNFYNAAGTATPITLDSPTDGELAIGVANNTISFALKALTASGLSASEIIRSITVDKFGRVTAVSGSALTNADIPNELSGKVLDGCTTKSEDIADDNKAIVNKKYVDDKFNTINTIATGALRFGGTIGSLQSATNTLSNVNNANHYYKATADFELSASQVYGNTKASVKIGDTLIVYAESDTTRTFVHIPSGDDITAITVKSNDTPVISSQVGQITFKYDSIFSVADTGGNIISISMPEASATKNGYLSAEDWQRFNSYSSTLSTTYVGEFSSGAGVYEIGKLNIGGVENIIYGKNYESYLELTNGETNATNPILKFTETGRDDVNITLRGSKGIATKKNGNTVEFTAAVEAALQTVPSTQRAANYITVSEGYQVGVQIGGLDDNNNVIDGLVDFNQFNNLAINVTNRFNQMFEAISYSLKGAANVNEYRYGNEKLKAAVAITI